MNLAGANLRAFPTNALNTRQVHAAQRSSRKSSCFSSGARNLLYPGTGLFSKSPITVHFRRGSKSMHLIYDEHVFTC